MQESKWKICRRYWIHWQVDRPSPGLESINVEAIQLGDILAENFPLVFFTDSLEVLGDFFAGVGPESCAVGEVRRPEQIIHTNLAPMGYPKGIVDKCGV